MRDTLFSSILILFAMVILLLTTVAESVTVGCVDKDTPSADCCQGSIELAFDLDSVASSAFSGCSNITGVLTIPNSVTSIGDGAFSGCSGFTGSLIIPDSVTSIGSSVFHSCSGFNGSLTIVTV